MRKCSAPNCRGNYKNGPRVSIFKFPSDDTLRKKWIAALKREVSFSPTNNCGVCEKHFLESDILRTTSFFDEKNAKTITAPLSKPRLKENAVPLILPDCPSYLPNVVTPRESADERRQRLEEQQLQIVLTESLNSHEEFLKNKSFSNFVEFLNCLDQNRHYINGGKQWEIIKRDEEVLFLVIDTNKEGPRIHTSVVVDCRCDVRVYDSMEIQNLDDEFSFPFPLKSFIQLDNILTLVNKKKENDLYPNEIKLYVVWIERLLSKLREIVSEEQLKCVNFLLEQVHFINTPPARYRYSTDFLIVSSIFLTISPHAYKFVRDSYGIILPHPRTIHKICARYNTNPLQEQNDANFLSEVKQRKSQLDEKELLVMLLMDEIYIKSYFDYKGGNVVGSSYNCEKSAKTAHVFMLKSFLSDFKEVAHILPVHSITAKELHQFMMKLMEGLHQIGFKVLCIVSDNNSINRKTVSYFNSPPELKIQNHHPFSDLPLFFLFDSVHILKCIRNNWINKKDDLQSFAYPKFYNDEEFDDDNGEDGINTCIASFAAIKQLYHIEEQQLVKFAYSLNVKALTPTNFERQNVKYVLNVIHESVIQGLHHYGVEKQIPSYQSTADFVTIILDWWNVVNVRTIFKGVRQKNVLANPLTLKNEGFLYLEQFSNWLHRWKENDELRKGFTNETFTAISHTTIALLQLTEYCIKTENFLYFLPGKVQTNALEERFGKYRMMTGGQYLISMRQIYEVVNKLRLQNWLPLQLTSKRYGKINILDIEDIKIPDEELEEEVIDSTPFEIDFELDEYIEDIESNLPNLTYISGVCLRRALKKVKCAICADVWILKKDIIGERAEHELIRNQDRGGLILPHCDVVTVVSVIYVIIQQLISPRYETQFLKVNNQRQIAMSLTMKAVGSEIVFENENPECSNKDHSLNLLKYIARTAINTFLDRYVRKRNQETAAESSNKKRKLNTVKKN